MSDVKVMTRNLYLGVAIDPFLGTKDPSVIPEAVAEAWQMIGRCSFPERAGAIADEIAAHEPHLVGLQEAWTFRLTRPQESEQGSGEAGQDLDYLALLLSELADRGMDYTAVAAATGPHFALPSSSGHQIEVRDRDVVLCRPDVQVLAARGGQYDAGVIIPVGGQEGVEMASRRAWALVEAVVDGQALRFATTHLETPVHARVQLQQADELLRVMGQPPCRTVLVGDLNSGADGDPAGENSTDTLDRIIAAGFVDAWRAVNPSAAGYTCGQAEDLRNPASTLDARIDLILARGVDGAGLVPRTAVLVGNAPEDRTRSGMWPSDHAGVVATLALTQTQTMK